MISPSKVPQTPSKPIQPLTPISTPRSFTQIARFSPTTEQSKINITSDIIHILTNLLAALTSENYLKKIIAKTLSSFLSPLSNQHG